MGMQIKAVSKRYRYSKRREEYVGSEYAETESISYARFYAYREYLTRTMSLGMIDGINAITYKYGMDGMHAGNLKTGEIFTSRNFPRHMRSPRYKYYGYWQLFKQFITDFPELEDLWPFLCHSDCDGTMGWRQAKTLIPYLKLFQNAVDIFTPPAYRLDFIGFSDQLIDCCEAVVRHKGKLIWE